MLFQGLIDEVFGQFGVVGQSNEFFRPTVNLTALIVHQALAQSLVGRHLVLRLNGGVNVQPTGVGVLAILGEDHLPDGFCDKFGMQGFFVAR